MQTTFLRAVLFLLILSTGAFAGEKSSDRNDWKLVWQDEFNDKTLSTNKWNVLIREQSKHNELQYYVPDEVYIEKGCLRLRSRVRDYGSQHYTSGRVDTSGKFAPVYGRFEIRAKLPGGKGLWPAHWLYPQNRNWEMERLMEQAVADGKEKLIPEERPWYSEIDIMEFLGHTNVIYGTLHYCTHDGERKSNSGHLKGDTDFTKDFHIYALEWEPDIMRWYVDGQLIHSTTKGIPHTPHYLILNTAVGGNWPGNPDETTVFPQYHDIDYVRVYQHKEYFKREE
ncbi:glycoside hydrolase family 16 protein [Pedosphaera parvula]|uniref:Glycoside hydrolase family 16 n=1 Tax=Pedosphaera parvula (strain Ellin514) TaxID=320771 RepID=B9XR91_PEDPL|nr:glycoside hydrolase family 16 protein [Pedosphaera parvula]EEF57634.1 glycoside hydrolase family 16 [Pedosphaera parvula Ellin514]